MISISNKNSKTKIIVLLIFLSAVFTVQADDNKFNPFVKGDVVQFGKSPIFIRDVVIRVVMSGPGDYQAEHTYYGGQDITWKINVTGDKHMPSGSYNYEVTQSHRTSPRNTTPIDLEGRTQNPSRASGTLTIEQGRWVSPAANENPQTRDQLITEELTVQGSICAGIDCSNDESYDFDTIRLKENNVRIRFVDTSSSASFPTTDWELRANDTTNGGANKFSIADLDRDNEIFSVEAAAPANSLYVDDRGRVGFGTNAPVLDQHLLSGNTPATRFEQDGSGGFPAQTWDIGGNETEFFIRDSTSAQVPVRVQPGAPSDSLIVNTAGDIEIGGSIVTNRYKLPNKVLKSKGQRYLNDLSSVERYIIENQQLPGVGTHGKDLIQLQLKLLEKIQELTLYTIDQEKRIALLESELKNK